MMQNGFQQSRASGDANKFKYLTRERLSDVFRQLESIITGKLTAENFVY
jgi:hypothetical protein